MNLKQIKRNLIYLCYLLFEINAAIDSGKYNNITMDEIKKHIEEGDIFDFLNQEVKEMDLSLLDDTDILILGIVKRLQDISIVLSGQERRKCGIEKTGLCLLLAYVIEMVQQGLQEIEKINANS